MATMIPPAYSDSTSSNAERKVFNWLQKDSGTSDWTVFHSLNLSVQTSRRYGEIDFVLLIPGLGIVCLEVKGGGIRCDNGVWSSTGADRVIHELKRSPFAQARANMFSLRERMSEHFGRTHALCSVPIGFIAVYPDCKCPPESPEFTRAEVIDCDDLGEPISKSIFRYAKAKLTFPNGGAGFKQGPLFKELRTFLRPDFDRAIARSATIGNSEGKIIEFTTEQLERLEELEANPRCLFEGAAGTGKTLLALHLAKERAAEGKRVLFICFNRLLGRWLTKEAGVTPRLRAGSFLSTLRKLVLLSEFENQYLDKEQSIPGNELSGLVCEYGRLAILEFEEQFDVLVVDEIQDLSSAAIFSVFDDWLVGGLSDGEWAFFGDFTRQSLYKAAADGSEVLKKYCPSLTRSKLLRNCRNTRQIAEAATVLSGFDKYPYKASIADGTPVQYHYWKDRSDQLTEIEDCIRKYVADGIVANDIVILSPYRPENSGLNGTNQIAGIPLVDVADESRPVPSGSMGFSTVHAFKGLESSVILLVDIEAVGLEDQKAMLYVGMSRARSALHVFASRAAKASISELVSKLKQ